MSESGTNKQTNWQTSLPPWHRTDINTYISVRGRSSGTACPADMRDNCAGLDIAATLAQTSLDTAHRSSTSAQQTCRDF